VVGDADRVDYVALYTWYLGDGRPVLLHEAKYQTPAARPDPPPAVLTGRQYLYAPGLERELQYSCALGVALTSPSPASWSGAGRPLRPLPHSWPGPTSGW
jgi:hypothetical protein